MEIFRLLTILLVGFISVFVSACGGGVSNEVSPDKRPEIQYNRVQNMPTGFKITGDHGYVQIDDTFFNYSLRSKGTVLLQDRAQITIAGDMPMLCFRNLSQFVNIESVSGGNGSFTYVLRGESALPAELITYYVFDKVPVVQQWGAAMVWNAQGQPVYNSDYPVMRISANVALPATDPWSSPVTASASAGTYAACLAMPRVRQTSISDGGSGFLTFAEASRVTSTGAETTLIPVASIGAPVDGFLAGGGFLMLVDVAGL